MRDKKNNILTLVLSEKKILNETKNYNPPLQVKWSVPKHINIARVEKTDEFKYKLSGKNIERVQKEKDIRVTIDSELTFESHICEK